MQQGVCIIGSLQQMLDARLPDARAAAWWQCCVSSRCWCCRRPTGAAALICCSRVVSCIVAHHRPTSCNCLHTLAKVHAVLQELLQQEAAAAAAARRSKAAAMRGSRRLGGSRRRTVTLHLHALNERRHSCCTRWCYPGHGRHVMSCLSLMLHAECPRGAPAAGRGWCCRRSSCRRRGLSMLHGCRLLQAVQACTCAAAARHCAVRPLSAPLL